MLLSLERVNATPSLNIPGLQACTMVMRWISFPRGIVCFVSAALMFHLISFLATERTLQQQTASGFFLYNLLHFLTMPGWARTGREHQLCPGEGGFRSGFCRCTFWGDGEVGGILAFFPPKNLSLGAFKCILATSMLRELANHCPVTGRKWSLLFIYNANSEVSPEVW